jgi:hypothetical protein
MIKPFLSINSLKRIYHACFYSVMSYGLNFWGNFLIQIQYFSVTKRMIRILMGARLRDSCRELFKILNVLHLASQYIFSLALFMVNNKSLFSVNSEIHNFSTRNNSNNPHLHMFQKGPIYAGIKIFNHLSTDIKDLSNNVDQFKKAL